MGLSNLQKKTALIFGMGYLGSRVADRLLADGFTVYGVTRSQQKARRMGDVRPVVADWSNFASMRDIPVAGRVLVAVGWDRRSGQSQYEVYVGGLRNALRMLHPESSVAYVSSTGVYHQTDGRWVDEVSPCRPIRGAGGWAHLQAEQLLERTNQCNDYRILRMAGLYGPDRVPRAKDILAGGPLAFPTNGYLNLIHIDDAARCVMAAWETQSNHRTFVVSDGSPVLRRSYYEEIARIIKAPPLQFVKPGDSIPAARRAQTNKRICNARMHRELHFDLRYPTYKQGLRDILQHR